MGGKPMPQNLNLVQHRGQFIAVYYDGMQPGKLQTCLSGDGVRFSDPVATPFKFTWSDKKGNAYPALVSQIVFEEVEGKLLALADCHDLKSTLLRYRGTTNWEQVCMVDRNRASNALGDFRLSETGLDHFGIPPPVVDPTRSNLWNAQAQRLVMSHYTFGWKPVGPNEPAGKEPPRDVTALIRGR
jgi:hypothetical protein